MPENDKNKTGLEHLFKYINGGEPEDDLCRELDAEVKKQRQDVNKKGVFVMWEQILTERADEAEKKGKIEAKIEAIKNLMDSCEWTIEQAMKALKIPEADYPKYIAML